MTENQKQLKILIRKSNPKEHEVYEGYYRTKNRITNHSKLN